MVSENKGIDIEKLARNIAADINKLDKVTSETGGLKDLRSVDFSAFLTGSTTEILKGRLNQFKAKADEASQQNKKQVEEISGQIEGSINARRAKLASGLKELRKTAIKNDAEAKTILNHVSDKVDVSTHRLYEMEIEKTLKTSYVRLTRTSITNVDIEKK